MEIAGYTYITHKLISRPWGSECRFTVKTENGVNIDDVIPVPSTKIEENDLAKLILARLDLRTAPPEQPFVVAEREQYEREVMELLVNKGYLKQGEALQNLKSADEFTAAFISAERAK